MKALVLTEYSGPGGLEVREVPDPIGDVVVEVGAAGVNFPDLLAMKGEYQLRTPVPFVPGSEVAGTVLSAPPHSVWKPGDRVIGLCTSGGYAQYASVPEPWLHPAPPELDDAQAVAVVANHQTAYFALSLRTRIEPGDRVVVLGAAGGLGSACVQVAAGLGANVVAVVRRPGAEDFVRSLGAHEVVRLEDGWGARVRDRIGGADVLVDPVGGETFDEAVRVLDPGGQLVVLGFAGGGIPTIKVNRLLLRNIGLVGAGWGEWLRTSPDDLGAVASGIADLVAAGLRPPVTGRFPLSDGREAIELLARGGVLGKVVIEPNAKPTDERRTPAEQVSRGLPR